MDNNFTKCQFVLHRFLWKTGRKPIHKASHYATQFRAYSQATQDGGGNNITSEDGGADTITSEGGGADTVTSGDSGVEVKWGTASTESAGDPAHSHSFERVTAHKHKVVLGTHAHRIILDEHSHVIKLKPHGHGITPGIFYFGSPSAAGILINGTRVAEMGAEINTDLTQYLLIDGQIPRNQWIQLGILPNDLAYITIDLIVVGFIQSRIGGNY